MDSQHCLVPQPDAIFSRPLVLLVGAEQDEGLSGKNLPFQAVVLEFVGFF